MSLINGEELEDVVTKLNEQGFGITRNEFKRIELVISEFPTVKAKPIKRGHWIKRYKGNYKCSECNSWWACAEEEIYDMNYCPNCGAKMSNKKKVAK